MVSERYLQQLISSVILGCITVDLVLGYRSQSGLVLIVEEHRALLVAVLGNFPESVLADSHVLEMLAECALLDPVVLSIVTEIVVE